jgi:iron complex transport system permease protein
MKKETKVMVFLLLLLLITVLMSLTIGRYGIPIRKIYETFTHAIENTSLVKSDKEMAVLFLIRIPRIFIAIICGASLAMSGAVYQGIFKNPLVSPDIMGVSSGAGVGACLGILLSFSSPGVQAMAFTFGLCAVGAVLFISYIMGRGRGDLLIMVLAGTVISSLCSAFISLMKYMADADSKLPEITFWLMGSFAKSGSWRNAGFLGMAFLLGGIPLYLLRWKINALSFGEEEAQAMGIDTKKLYIIIIACATLLTASTVSVCGIIGWVGLIMPHMVRSITGPNYKYLLPACALGGAIFMLIVDNIARSLTTGEIPIGILTAIIGAPLFIYLLLKERRRDL